MHPCDGSGIADFGLSYRGMGAVDDNYFPK